MWFRSIFRANKSTRLQKDNLITEEIDKRLDYLSHRTIRQLDHLQLRANKFLPGMGVGLRPSLQSKAASDFREHRKYVPGDDMRYVDWRASARHEHIFVKQGEQPREISVYILLDCSESMLWGGTSKMTLSLELTAAMGYCTLAHGDKLTIYPFSDQTQRVLGPISGKGQVPNLYRYLDSLHYGGETNYISAVEKFRSQVMQGGLTIVITDLLGMKDLSLFLDFIPAPTFDVFIFQILHPDEISPKISGNVELVDIEMKRKVNYDITENAHHIYRTQMEEWFNNLDLACIDKSAIRLLIEADRSLDHQVIPHLRSSNILLPI